MAQSCEDVSARMMELLYGELPEGERAAIEAHVAGCDRCRTELAELRETRAIARQALDETPPARAHAAILRAAAAAVAARPRAPEKRAAPVGPSFWDRLRSRWTFPTLATVGAVAVFLLASKIFLEPEKTYERGRQGLVPTPVEAPAPTATTDEPGAAPAAEAPAGPGAGALRRDLAAKDEFLAPGTGALGIAAPAEAARINGAVKGAGTTGLGGLGAIATSSENKRRAVPDGLAKKKSEAAAHGAFAEPPTVARAERSFAQPPPPRNIHPAKAAGADDSDALLDREESESSRQSAGRASGGGGADNTRGGKKSAAPARSATQGFAGLDNDLAGSAGAPAGRAAPTTPARAAPREKSASSDRAAPAPAPAAPPAPPPPPSAHMAAKRDQSESAAAEEAVEAEEAPTLRDKSTRKAETPVAHADRLFSEGRWAEAAAAYRDLIRRDPRNADANRWRQRLAAAEAALAPTAP